MIFLLLSHLYSNKRLPGGPAVSASSHLISSHLFPSFPLSPLSSLSFSLTLSFFYTPFSPPLFLLLFSSMSHPFSLPFLSLFSSLSHTFLFFFPVSPCFSLFLPFSFLLSPSFFFTEAASHKPFDERSARIFVRSWHGSTTCQPVLNP